MQYGLLNGPPGLPAVASMLVYGPATMVFGAKLAWLRLKKPGMRSW